MTRTAGMLMTYPADLGGADRQQLTECIEACFECVQVCTACADACLSEQNAAELVKCIATNRDCADICDTTGRVLSRHTEYDTTMTRAMLDARATACKACGDECAHHAGMGMAPLQDLRRGVPALRAGVHQPHGRTLRRATD